MRQIWRATPALDLPVALTVVGISVITAKVQPSLLNPSLFTILQMLLLRALANKLPICKSLSQSLFAGELNSRQMNTENTQELFNNVRP